MFWRPQFIRDRSGMDPLSDVLSLLKPCSYACGGFDMAGAVCIAFPKHDGIKCYAVVAGQVWLTVDGEPDAVVLRGGDCFILPRGRPFRLASDPAAAPIDYRTILAGRVPGAVPANGSGNPTMVGGHFALNGRHADLLLSALPPIVHLNAEPDRAALRWALDRMMLEIRTPQPGGHLIVEHLAQMMLVQALRLHMSEGQSGRVGWLFALSDPEIGPALEAMHAEAGHPWTLQSLAQHVGMSRTKFAVRFKATVGSSAMEYLTRWRMLAAGNRLVCSRDPISDIARSLGYESESAFSVAFKRVMGCSPRQYGRDQAVAWGEAPQRVHPQADAQERVAA